MTHSDTRWVIVGKCGLYTGQWLTREDAIREHVHAKYFIAPPAQVLVMTHLNHFQNEKAAWDWCRKKGDKAIKAQVVWKE